MTTITLSPSETAILMLCRHAKTIKELADKMWDIHQVPFWITDQDIQRLLKTGHLRIANHIEGQVLHETTWRGLIALRIHSSRSWRKRSRPAARG